jgi:hypothetical protein
MCSARSGLPGRLATGGGLVVAAAIAVLGWPADGLGIGPTAPHVGP